MSNKANVNNEPVLEDINSKLFNSFDPEEELWILGGNGAEPNASGTGTATGTYTPAGPDVDADLDFDF